MLVLHLILSDVKMPCYVWVGLADSISAPPDHSTIHSSLALRVLSSLLVALSSAKLPYVTNLLPCLPMVRVGSQCVSLSVWPAPCSLAPWLLMQSSQVTFRAICSILVLTPLSDFSCCTVNIFVLALTLLLLWRATFQAFCWDQIATLFCWILGTLC